MRAVKFASGTVELDDRTVIGVASDGSPDRAGDVLDPAGCCTDNFESNNVVLANHDPTKPIGTASVRVTVQAVIAAICFAPKGISPLADEWCALAKAGVLNALSVGFESISKEPRPGSGWLFRKWSLLELSVVAVGCNPSALIMQRSMKSGAAPLQKMCGFLIRNDSPSDYVQRAKVQAAARTTDLYAAFERPQTAREERITIVEQLTRTSP
jgi:HK97 family phage prohead protease